MEIFWIEKIEMFFGDFFKLEIILEKLVSVDCSLEAKKRKKVL
jgi:hypothetical protein